MNRYFEVCSDHANACHETNTVVEKLMVDNNPKLRYKMSDLGGSKRHSQHVESLSYLELLSFSIALASRSTV